MCKPHGTPSTWPLEDQEFYMSFSLQNSHSNPGQNLVGGLNPSETYERQLGWLSPIWENKKCCKPPTRNRLNTNALPSGTLGTFQRWTTHHIGIQIVKVPLDKLDNVIFTRSLRGLYEIWTRSRFCKGRQQGKALYPALLYSTLPYCPLDSSLLDSFLPFPSLAWASPITSTLQVDSLLCSSVYSLFYCSLFCVKLSPSWSLISQRMCVKNMRVIAKH